MLRLQMKTVLVHNQILSISNQLKREHTDLIQSTVYFLSHKN